MYTFGKDYVCLGMRFYKFISEDEYKIFVLVKILDDNNSQFMDEETFELVNIDKTTLLHEYTLLIDFFNYSAIINTRTKGVFNLTIATYKNLKKVVFQKTINNILTLNHIYTPIVSETKDYNGKPVIDTLEYMWEVYLSILSQKFPVLILNRGNQDEFNGNRISNIGMMGAEELLSTYILSYDVYEYDDYINLSNVNMKYFFMYDCYRDKWYIVLYMIDTSKVNQMIIENMEENIDLIEFMDQ